MPSGATHLIAVLASGEGTNFEALALAARRGELPGRIAVLLCDRSDAHVLARAKALSIEALCPPAGPLRTRLADEQPWIEALRERRVDTVLLAGFMRRLHPAFLDAFPRTLNLHPSLLPAFPGLDAIARAWDAGVRITGCTVHVVEAEIDAGPIVAQAAIEVQDDDTLATLTERVHAVEHRLYPEAVRRYLSERPVRNGRRLEFGRTLTGASHA